MQETYRPGAGIPAPHKGHTKKVMIVAFILLGLGVTLFLTVAILMHRASGILRNRVINTLSTRYEGRVELPRFQVSIFRGFEVTGGGLKIWPDALPQKQPLFAVGEFHFHTMWWNLLRSPMHVGEVEITDLHVNLPPKDQRKNIPHGPPPGEKGRKRKIEIIVDQLQIRQAQMVLGTDKPDKDPLVFNIQNLDMQTVGRGQPMHFHAILVNPKPIGNIDSSGYFGPFNVEDVGASPVRGEYSFSHADLNTIHGIGGMLSSKGKYDGVLDKIVVDGHTDTPDFSIDVSGRPVPLHTDFHAIVDGTNGDTDLDPVDAYLRGSHIVARGAVERVKGKGHHIHLNVDVGHPADIYDMLDLAMKTKPPIMHGALTLHTSLDLPPGKQRVAEKLHLKGRFAIRDATFTNPNFQSKVDQLSLRGSGKPKEAKAAADANVKIGSDMQGNFELGSSRLTISGLTYAVPGADIGMQGVYSMDGKEFDFHGKVRLKARVSQMVADWWKKVLLKPVDPIFAKNGVGTEVPVSVTGTNGSPKFGVDLFHHGDKKDKAAKEK